MLGDERFPDYLLEVKRTPAADEAGGPALEEVANEIMRLRLIKSQHEELRAQLATCEDQLARLSPQYVLHFRNYLERHLRDGTSSLQEPLVGLLQCLSVVHQFELTSISAESLLGLTRKLFRNPHCFAQKLCQVEAITAEEAKSLAPFLLTSAPFRPVREKEVNECYSCFHSWLSAFYLFSVVYEQIAPTTAQLQEQENLLKRLGDDRRRVRSARAPQRQSTGSRNAPVSPLSASRSLKAGAPPPRGSPATQSPRERPSPGQPPSSRSLSPARDARQLTARRSVARTQRSPVVKGAAPPPVGSARCAPAPLARVQSERTLPARKARDSRSPSPGARAPAAPPPRVRETKRSLSRSPSEGSLPGRGVERMVSAPTLSASRARVVTRQVQVRPQPSVTRHDGRAPLGSARAMSPDRGGGWGGSISARGPASGRASGANTSRIRPEDDGPSRRQLSAAEYEELVRAVQQVVMTSAPP